ncbi:MAG: cytosine deaminase [Alphaproteobacteria bacterium]
MPMGFAVVPKADHYTVARATVPVCLVDGVALEAERDGLAPVDIGISAGRIETITPSGPVIGPLVDCDGGMVFPCFVDAHTHLDKGHIWPRASNPDGTFPGALNAVMADRAAHWSADDVRARMNFSLQSAYAHGTSAIRTHIDSIPAQVGISWPVLAEMREEWRGRIDLQASSLCSIDTLAEPGFLDQLIKALKAHGGTLGAVTYPTPNLQSGLDLVFKAALDHGLKLDFHVDETLDPSSLTLKVIAQTALRFGWPQSGHGRIIAGHCCSMSVQDDAEIDRTLDLVASAGIAVVSLPMCNMYLQDRTVGRTPRRRGVTLLHEMKALGIPVMVASDNTRDPFYAYGDMDGLEVYRAATRILHFDHPVADWPAAITRTPADACGFTGHGVIKAGAGADLVLFRGRTWTELLSRPESNRTVIRNGRAIDRTLPDYRDLDVLWSRS